MLTTCESCYSIVAALCCVRTGDLHGRIQGWMCVFVLPKFHKSISGFLSLFFFCLESIVRQYYFIIMTHPKCHKAVSAYSEFQEGLLERVVSVMLQNITHGICKIKYTFTALVFD